jgi:2-haloacid dehalogenase
MRRVENSQMRSRRRFVGVWAGAFAAVATRAVGARQGTRRGSQRRHILVLDVIETMLDINALEPQFVRAFGDGGVLKEWFSNLLLYSNVATVAGPYADFGTLAGAVLDMTAAAHGTMLPADDRARILQGTLMLPPHPDVKAGLQRLKADGFRLVTLTNSAPATVAQQLKNAGLADFFERSFSVDAVKKFKPSAETYQYVARELGVMPADLRMIAAHAWDVVGAMRAGCTAAFVSRRDHALFPLGPRPDITGADLGAVAERIIATEPR